MFGNYENCLKCVLDSEGGYINHPSDPGGATNFGITKQAWADYLKIPVSNLDIKNLDNKLVADFYKKKYWDVCKCDLLPAGIDYCVFDYAVHSGPSRAIKTLQKSLDLVVDGIIGSQTLSKVQNLKDKKIIVMRICAQRMVFLKSLAQYPIFGKGWLSRVMKVQSKAMGVSI